MANYNMRKVIYFDWERVNKIDKHLSKVRKGEATFLSWGFDYEETDMGVGTYSVAILELASGDVIGLPVELIKFVNDTRH